MTNKKDEPDNERVYLSLNQSPYINLLHDVLCINNLCVHSFTVVDKFNKIITVELSKCK